MIEQRNLSIPLLCRNSNLLITLLIGQSIVTCVWLLVVTETSLQSYALYSLYSQTMLLLSCSVLCLVRDSVATLEYLNGVLCTALLVVASCLLVELLAQTLDPTKPNSLDLSRFVRVALASFLVFLVVTRIFHLLTILDSRSKAEAESRLIALQSKIQPHFLFNSLNTISELVQSEPEEAERAIHSLSILFRSSLENSNNQHSLKNEISLCNRYLELEQWRFDSDLQVRWNIVIENSYKWLIPKLVLQPIIENAIKYGRSLDGCIDILIDIRETKQDVSIFVENSKDSRVIETRSGHGIALDNIRERLSVLFDDAYAFKIRDSEEKYSILVRVPKVVNPAA